MDIGFLAIMVYWCYLNGARARLLNKNGILWGLFTAAASFAAMMAGTALVIYFCHIDLSRVALDPKYKETATRELTQAFANNPLHLLTVIVFSIGGYLLVRYILERNEPVKSKE